MDDIERLLDGLGVEDRAEFERLRAALAQLSPEQIAECVAGPSFLVVPAERRPDAESDEIMARALHTVSVMRLGSTSRNQREGRYVGVWNGRHLRTRRPIFIVGRPDADVAWALASQRAGRPLAYPERRIVYQSMRDAIEGKAT